MSGPNGPDSQTPAVSYSTIGSTGPSIIDNFTATNGANTNGQNEGKDITWTVTATSNGIDTSSFFGVSVSNFPEISVCSLSNVATTEVPAGSYDIKLKCIDAGNAFQEITVTAQLGVIPVNVTDISFTYNTGTPENPTAPRTSSFCCIEVNNAVDPGGTNGFYVLNGSFASVSSGVDTISLKQVNNCPGPWFYSASSLTAAFNNAKSCFTNDFPQTRTDTPVPTSTYLAKGYEVIS